MSYYLDFALPLPDEDAHMRIDCRETPVDSISDLYQLFVAGCHALSERGFTGQPWWHAVVVEDDGSERMMNEVELAALAAAFEQAVGGRFLVEFSSDEEPKP